MEAMENRTQRKRRKFSGGDQQLQRAIALCRSYEEPHGFETKAIDEYIGEGVFTTKDFSRGDFLLEYKGDLIKNLKHARRLEKEYEDAETGCFMYFFKYRERTMCLDATLDIFTQGRMINDAEKGDPMQNCLMKVVEVDNTPHLCIFASRAIPKDEELRYDYGVTTLPWRKKCLKKIEDESSVDGSLVDKAQGPMNMPNVGEASSDECMAMGIDKANASPSPKTTGAPCHTPCHTHRPISSPVQSDYSEADKCLKTIEDESSVDGSLVDKAQGPMNMPNVGEASSDECMAMGIDKANASPSPKTTGAPCHTPCHTHRPISSPVQSDYSEADKCLKTIEDESSVDGSLVDKVHSPMNMHNVGEASSDECMLMGIDKANASPSPKTTGAPCHTPCHTDQPISSPVKSDYSEADDDRDSDYIPGSDVSSDESAIVQMIPDIQRFKKPTTIVNNITEDHEINTSIQDRTTSIQNNSTSIQDSTTIIQNNGDHSSCSSDLPTNIALPKTNNTEYRHYDKRFYCLFCDIAFAKLSKHLLAKHKEEDDVQKYMIETNKDAKSLLFEKMRNVGNHLHNVRVLKSGSGELAVAYRPRENQSLTYDDYGPCPNCYAYFPRNKLWRHNRSCKFASEGSKRSQLAVSSRLLLPKSNDSSDTLAKVLAGLKSDEVSRIAKSDPTILTYGEKLSSKQGHDKEQHNYIRQKLREMARLLRNMREADGNTSKSLEDFIYPNKFKFIVKCCKTVAGFDSTTNTYSTPSLALKVGGTLQKCLKILISKAIETGNRDLQTRSEDLSKLFDYNWTDEVSSNALRTLGEGKRNAKKGLLPLANDVKTMAEYLRDEADACSQRLREDDNAKEDWVHLSEICLTQTILFNRRRAGEVSKMTIGDFEKRSLTNEDGELDDSLTGFEKALCKSFYRTEIVAKRGRISPVIFPTNLKANIELLLQKRHIINNCRNGFLFPTQTTDSHIRGTDVMREYASQCGAKQPERLRSTKLRKHIATMTQLLNLNENELDILANFLGHDIRVHRQFYRLPEATLQVAKVSKLLLMMESGKIKNTDINSLDDIDVEEEVLDGEGEEKEYGDSSESSEDEDVQKTKKRAVPTNTSQSAAVGAATTSKQNRVVSERTPRAGKRCAPKKRQWSTEEKNAVFRHLDRNITMGNLPGKRQIVQCIAAEHALSNRNWKNVKDFCRNLIENRKKKDKL